MNTFDIFVRLVDIDGMMVVVISGVSIEVLEANQEVYDQVKQMIKDLMDQHQQHGLVYRRIEHPL